MSKVKGLTLIELLAALTIASALAIASLRVATRLTSERRIHQSSQRASSLEAGLRQALVADVVHARRYRNSANGLALQTQSRLDPKTLAVEHFPVRVQYQVRRIGRRSWLLRTQHLAAGGSSTQVVCEGVTRIQLRSGGKYEWKAMPAAANVAIEFAGTGRNSTEFTFHTKWVP